jgi:hypothetical protein
VEGISTKEEFLEMVKVEDQEIKRKRNGDNNGEMGNTSG